MQPPGPPPRLGLQPLPIVEQLFAVVVADVAPPPPERLQEYAHERDLDDLPYLRTVEATHVVKPLARECLPVQRLQLVELLVHAFRVVLFVPLVVAPLVIGGEPSVDALLVDLERRVVRRGLRPRDVFVKAIATEPVVRAVVALHERVLLELRECIVSASSLLVIPFLIPAFEQQVVDEVGVDPPGKPTFLQDVLYV